MKKLLGAALVGLMSLVCAACGTKNETAICTKIPEDVTGVAFEITLDAENGIVQTMTQLTTIELSYFSEDDVELVEETMDALEDMYKNYSGVQFSAEVKDDEIYYETIVIDMTNANTLESLRENELLPIEGEANKTSLDKVVEQLKSVGWTVEMK